MVYTFCFLRYNRLMKHKHKKTHDDIIIHFQKRCMERLGFIISQRELKDMKDKDDGRMVKLGKQSNTKTLYKVYKHPGFFKEDLVVVYDKLRHGFVTVMFYNEWMQNQRPDLKFTINHPEYVYDK